MNKKYIEHKLAGDNAEILRQAMEALKRISVWSVFFFTEYLHFQHGAKALPLLALQEMITGV